jgi:hypothetical protein
MRADPADFVDSLVLHPVLSLLSEENRDVKDPILMSQPDGNVP